MEKVASRAPARLSHVEIARSDGWSLRSGYFDMRAAAALEADIERLVREPATHERCMYFHGTDPAGERRLTRIERIWEAMPSLHSTGLARRMTDDAEAFLGGAVSLFKDKLNIRYAGSAGYAPHQDSVAGWEAFSERFVSIGLFLHRSDPHHGGFEVATRAHRSGRYSNVKGQMSEADCRALDPLAVVAERGDAILLDSEAPHKTVDNLSKTDSLHLLFTFAEAGPRDIRSEYYSEKQSSFAGSRRGNSYEFRVFAF